MAGNPVRIMRLLASKDCRGSKAFFVASNEMSNDKLAAFFTGLHRRLMSRAVPSEGSASEHGESPAAADGNGSRRTEVVAASTEACDHKLCRKRLLELKGSRFAAQGASIVTTGQWAAVGFPAIHLTPAIDWQSNPFSNRTWCWYLHQFHFLLPLLAHALTADDQQAAQLGLQLARAWSDRYLADRSSENAWHDHGTAKRARHVLLLRQYMLDEGCLSADDALFLERFLRTHAEVLASDSFYSRSTNHGLDQSLVLLEITMELDDARARNRVADIALQRIHHEVSHAFAPDGGHVENSPAYLNYGLKQAFEAEATARSYIGESAQAGLDEPLMDFAIRALAYMVRPDRTLPLIGDTSHFVVRAFAEARHVQSYPLLQFAATAGRSGTPFTQQSLVLPDSGWAMVRSMADHARSFPTSLHLVFKCGFKSTYHRHDDDLSFVLWAFGEDWLIDGGLYKHAPQDPLRIYVRSADAHNLSIPIGARATRDLRHVTPDWGIHDHSDDGVVFRLSASSSMFRGFTSRRELMLDRSGLRLNLRDSISCTSDALRDQLLDLTHKDATTYLTRFICPSDKQIRIDHTDQSAHIVGKRHVLSIRCIGNATKIVNIAGRQKPTPYALTSARPGVMETAQAVEFHHSCVTLDAGFELQLGVRTQEEASNVE